MSDLIARLEAAERGSVDLSLEVWEALGRPKAGAWMSCTESVDAALALVPRDWYVDLSPPQHYADRPTTPAAAYMHSPTGPEQGRSDAATLPLAICAAVLRAQENNDD